MGRKWLKYLSLICKHSLFVCCVYLFVTSTIACTKSPGGSVEELIKTAAPNFNGLLTQTFLSASTTYVLNGNCDPISYGVEWSYNNSTWTEFPGGCPLGTFTLTVNFGGRKKVYIRARTKTGYTATAIATIKLLLPPTSPRLNLVNGSVSDDEEGRGMQASLESVATALSDTTPAATPVKIQSSSVDTAYGP